MCFAQRCAVVSTVSGQRPRHINQSPEKAKSIPRVTKKIDIVSAINMTQSSLETEPHYNTPTLDQDRLGGTCYLNDLTGRQVSDRGELSASCLDTVSTTSR